MDDTNNVAPVNHGVLSTTGTVAIGTAGGAIKSTLKVALWCIGIGVVVGVLAATGVLPIASMASGGVASAFWGTMLKVVAGTVVGGGLGAVVAAGLAPFAATFGAGKGALNASHRVSQEKGAANVLQAQVSAYQAQAQAAAANDNKYNFPAQGSPMNPAMASIQADSAQGFGPVAGQGLQRA